MKTSAMAAQIIFDRLHAAIGIDPSGLDPARLRWIIGVRCRHLNLPDSSAYAAFLQETPSELDSLIEEAVVQETRFFRDPLVFDHIRIAALQIAATTTSPLRLLSAPCGTGQEAYSLAAMLQLAGLPPTRFSIDAFDISQSALEIARRGLYPERAFSHVPAEWQDACGHHENKHWSIHEALRERIQFARRNLAHPGVLGEGPQYHLILCRNLFIYLAPTARASLAQSLSTVLLPGGRLFLGTADRVEELNAVFAPMRPAASFAFTHRKSGNSSTMKPATAITARLTTPAAQTGRTNRSAGKTEASAGSSVASADSPLPLSAAANELLRRALEHRRLGHLSKAERRCRQALYLVPDLLPALELLQLLWKENPNLRLRRALRDRILRNRLALPWAAAVESTVADSGSGRKEETA